MHSRVIYGTALLLLLAISVASALTAETQTVDASASNVAKGAFQIPVSPWAPIMVSQDVETLYAIGSQWNGMRSHWTREALRGACSSSRPVLGIQACDVNGYVAELNLTRMHDMGMLPRLESFQALSRLQIFRSELPFAQPLPASWMNMRNLRSIILKGTRITGGVIPLEWNYIPNLKSIDIEFSPIHDVFQYAGGPLPTWFERLDNLSLAFVNFGTRASFQTIISKVRSISLNNVGWDHMLPMSTNNPRLVSLTIVAPLAHSGGSSSPLPPRTTSLSGCYALKHVEIANVPTLTAMPYLPLGVANITLRNLQNMRGSVSMALNNLRSLVYFEISRCPVLTGYIPFPSTTATLLQTIIYRDVGFSGYMPSTIFRLPSLQTVVIAGLGKLTPSAMPSPYETADNCRLTSVTLIGLQMSGTIPRVLPTRCARLETIDISHNSLTGTLPATWPLGLRQLNVAFNQLSGTLPASLHFKPTYAPPSNPTWPGSNIFDIRSNRFTGSIPASYFAYRFELFDIADNHINVCQNTVALGNGPFNSLTYGSCSLAPQSQSICSCSHSWPRNCITNC